MARKSMLEHYYRQPKDDRPKRAHKVSACRRELRPIPGMQGKLYRPAIFKHKETGGTFYGGHIICASPRACPLCAQKVGEERAQEIRTAVDAWMAAGGLVLFVTLTFPHYAQDSLSDLLVSFKSALSAFRGGRSALKIRKELGYSGLIRAMETTWGEKNGWHPHSHELWFIRPGDDLSASLIDSARASRDHYIKTGKRETFGVIPELHAKLWYRWMSACIKSGLPAPSSQHGIRVEMAENEEQTRSRLSEYLAKSGLDLDPSAPVWGSDDELVRVHSKRGNSKFDRYTPFDFLREQFNPESTKQQKASFRELFAEFVEGYRGMAAVFWSRGLKALFRIDEVSDQEAAEKLEEPSFRIADLNAHRWAFVIGIEDHRAHLLNRAAESGLSGVDAFLDELLQRYYLDHCTDDFARLAPDARYLLSLPISAFQPFINDS